MNIRCFRNVAYATAASFVMRKDAIACSIVMRTGVAAAGGGAGATSGGDTAGKGDSAAAAFSALRGGVSGAAAKARASSQEVLCVFSRVNTPASVPET